MMSVVRSIAILAALAVVGLAFGSAPSSIAAVQRLPDLGMARVTKVAIDTTTFPGRKLLRYTSRSVNVGTGAFEVIGTRSSTSEPTLSVVQRVYDDEGGYTDVAIPGASMYWSGDGHNHWHITDFETGRLTPVAGGAVQGTLAKHGFHVIDSFLYKQLPGTPQTAYYRNRTWPESTSIDPDALWVAEGISVGWGDIYGYRIVDQWIDITGLANGTYRLTLGVNMDGSLQETSYTNNTVWARLTITDNTVEIIGRSRGA
jgi:hypothetical protein